MHTLTQTTQTAIQLDWDVINAIGDIMNEDRPKKVLKNTTNRLSEAEVLVESECCSFKTFVALHGLKSEAPFLLDGNFPCQIDTLYLFRSLCLSAGLKPVSKGVGSKYHLCLDALIECQKFEEFMGTAKWT